MKKQFKYDEEVIRYFNEDYFYDEIAILCGISKSFVVKIAKRNGLNRCHEEVGRIKTERKFKYIEESNVDDLYKLGMSITHIAKWIGISDRDSVSTYLKSKGIDTKPKRAISPEMEKIVRSMIKEGKTTQEISSKTNVSQPSIRVVARKYGLKITSSNGSHVKSLKIRKQAAETLDKMKAVERYKSGESLDEIRLSASVSTKIVRDYLTDRGVEIRINNRPAKSADLQFLGVLKN